MINQPKIIRDRKQSLNKFNENKENRTRSTTSLPKKTVISTPINNNGSYLLGWGNLPFIEDEKTFKKIGKNVIKFSCGEKHIVYVNHKYEAFGVGESRFKQLGYQQIEPLEKNVVVPLLEELIIQQVFCTPFCTFFLTNRDQVYGCGLNNRGQLGIGNANQVSSPIRIHGLSFSRNSLSPKLIKKQKSSKEKLSNKIQCYALAEKSQSKLVTEVQESEECLLSETQYITSIAGGPYHTVALSSKGKVFYTGNIYKRSSILNDQFTSVFTELNLKKIGKVQMIRAGLTSIGLLNSQGNLYILGALSDNIICDDPYSVGLSCIVDFSFAGNGCVYVLTSIGQVYTVNPLKKGIKVFKNESLQDIKQIKSGLDITIFVDSKNRTYSLSHSSSTHDMLLSSRQKQKEPSLMNFGNLYVYEIKCSPNFMIGLCERLPLQQKQNKGQGQKQNKRIEELQKQNKMLKELLKKQSQNMKIAIQKQQQPKFDINNKTNIKPRLFDPSLQIPFSQIKLGKQISEGGYGIIYKAIWRKTTVAVKIFKIDQNSQNSIKDFINECHAMEVLRHPNIVMFLGACTKPPNFAIVLEYCEGGTLWSILQKSGQLSWEDKRNFALDTAKGMNYLHDRPTPILHRDLKSLNLLLDQNKKVKLADFGWTKGLQNYMTGKIGTYQWMAPQVVSSYQYTEKADVFSFAIILWQIASRQAPYRNIPGVQVAHDVLHKDLRPPIPKKTPQNFINLMKRCWDKNHERRPSFIEIINELETMKLP